MVPAPTQEALSELALRARYVGSPEHKNHPSFAGRPAPRADASLCDPVFKDRQDELTEWLRRGILAGQIGCPWEGDFPRYVWLRQGDKVFEARLVNRELGHYKGWELRTEEYPEGLQ